MAETTAPRSSCCPRCGKSFTYTSVAEHRPFPFCSARCRDIDLGNWLMEKYSVPGPDAVEGGGEDERTGAEPATPDKDL